jgi:small ligand-binding sensory domain FIST
MTIATALATGRNVTEEIVRDAVAQAMARAGITHANSVLIFLTPEFARDPQPALRAASKAANCMQVVGCSAAGIFTEEDWILDTPAAAVMVFGGAVSLTPAHDVGNNELILALAAPNALNSAWIKAPGQRFGGVSGDATGQGPFKVWGGAKVSTNGRYEALLHGAHGVVGVSQGVRALTAPLEITQVSGHDVVTLTGQPALNVLARELPLEVREQNHIPLHLILAGVTFGDPDNAIKEGRYRLSPVISTNADDRSVTLSTRLAAGERMFWALRQPLAAERDMRFTIERVEKQLAGKPDFGLFFPCMGRGPYFYGGIDRDLELIKGRFPGMPIIGFYGNGEIGPLDGSNDLFQYSGVLGLFQENV